MNKRSKIISIIFILVLVGLLVFWFFYAPLEGSDGIEEIEENRNELSNVAECEETMAYEIVEGPFDADTPGGDVVVEGRIETEDFVLFGDVFTGIYLAISSDDPENRDAQEFYDYYVELAERGNTINLTSDDKLLFRLGVIDDGEISSTANISERAEAEILASLEGDDSVTFNMQIPVHLGVGAPPEFTFACKIESA